MAVSFPASPTSGQTYFYNGVTYVYASPVWRISRSASTSGTSGSSGTSGTSGSTGTSGSSGTSGASGSPGTSGTSGTSGVAGEAGSPGTSGTSGVSGSSGTSGTAGTSGTSGTSGSAGRSGFGGYTLYINYIDDTSPTISNLSTSALTTATGQTISSPTAVTYTPTQNTDVSALSDSPDLADAQTTIQYTTPASQTLDVIVAQFGFYKSLITPTTTVIPPGIWELNMYAKADAGNDENNIGLRFFLLGRNSTSGSYTSLVASGSDLAYLYDSVTSQIITMSMYVQNPIDISNYDAFVIALTSRNRNANSHAAQVYFQSSNTYSHLHTTFAKAGLDGTSGTSGTSGSSGTSGVAGEPGPAPDWYFQGTFSTSSVYEIGDIVTYEGETWYNPGGASNPPSVANGWSLLAAKGSSGTSGTSGVDGSGTSGSGTSGTSGTSGSSGTSGPAGISSFIKYTDGTIVTGSGGSNLYTDGVLIPANSVSEGSVIELRSRIRKTGTAGTVINRLYIGVNNSLTSANLVGLSTTMGSGTLTGQVVRTLVVKSATSTEVYPVTQAALNDDALNSATAVTTYNIDWTVDQYFVSSIQNQVAADSTRSSFLIAKIFK